VENVSTIGLDLAKHVFQAHGADKDGAVVFRKKLRRQQVLSFFVPRFLRASWLWKPARAVTTGAGKTGP
jgi:transposase